MKKLSFLSRTLESDLVKDGLCAISAIDNCPQSKGLISVAGGMAVQSYLPEEYRRATGDIDLLVSRPLNYEEFKQFSNPVSEYLQDNKYQVDTLKMEGAYGLLIGNNNDRLLIEFSRRNKQNFEKNRKLIERELLNSRRKKVEGREKDYSTLSPEDIALPKLVRSINALKRRPGLGGIVLQYQSPVICGASEVLLERINSLREETFFNIGNLELAEKLRFMSDLYDIRVLSELVGYNKNYMFEASKDWDTLREESPEKDKILRILPDI